MACEVTSAGDGGTGSIAREVSALDLASEPVRARAGDLLLLGHLLASQVAASTTTGTDFRRLWRTRVVPLAVEAGCEWGLGMTARVSGLKSGAGQPFNGRVGRISGRTDEGRCEVIMIGVKKNIRQEVLNVKPENLKAARLEEILRMWRRVSLAAHFRVRETARLMKAGDHAGPLPVTVLSGFLGAGKTTLLNHLLYNRLGYRLAIIVNDMSSINIDAELVRRGGLMHQEEKMVELSNGCICCTLREDLLTSITSLVADNRFDHVLVESSGISEPLPVAETFTFKDKASGVSLSDIASLHNLVTVVDAASIFEQLNTLDMLPDRGWQAGEGDARTVAQLLCDQLEFADVLIVNKADLVSDAQLGTVETFVKRINPKAEVVRTTHSELDPALLLGKARFNMQSAEEHPDWLKEARENEHTPETVEYGISSFVFRASLPFHPERLHAALGGRPRAGALRSLLRLKGFCWLAPWGSRQGVAALAGTQFTVEPGPPWWASVKPEHWPPGLKEEIQKDWHELYGDRRTELVCIGQDIDHAAAQAELKACLLTEEEVEAGPRSWFALRDPFYEAWEARQRLAASHGHEHDQHAEPVTHVLVLHKNESVTRQAAIGVMEMAGIDANTALPLISAVHERGRSVVARGLEEDMLLLAGMFGEIGMKTTIQQGDAPTNQ